MRHMSAGNSTTDPSANEYLFDQARITLLKLLPTGLKRALDVGCSAGATGAWLKKERGLTEVIGIELLEATAKKAEKVLDRVIVGDVEKIILDYPEEYFDLIIYADVLEHLKNPWEYLKQQSIYVKKNGYVLVSLPNIANWRVIADLLRNRWNYKNYGTLDRTHLRFFTLPGMKAMIHDSGYEIVTIKRNQGPMSAFVSTVTLGLLCHLVTFQYFFLLKKVSAR